MSNFDSVIATCPDCGEDVEFQSKNGDCVMATYRLPCDVPNMIAIGLDDASRRCTCGHAVTIRMGNRPPPGTIKMSVYK